MLPTLPALPTIPTLPVIACQAIQQEFNRHSSELKRAQYTTEQVHVQSQLKVKEWATGTIAQKSKVTIDNKAGRPLSNNIQKSIHDN